MCQAVGDDVKAPVKKVLGILGVFLLEDARVVVDHNQRQLAGSGETEHFCVTELLTRAQMWAIKTKHVVIENRKAPTPPHTHRYKQTYTQAHRPASEPSRPWCRLG